MESSFSLIILLLAALINAASAAHHHFPANKTHTHPKLTSPTPQQHSPPATPPPRPPHPQPSPAEIQETHFNKIIDALIGAGDFAGWANFLSTTDLQSLPLTATFFIPGNNAVANLSTAGTSEMSLDAFLIPYHIVPQRLTFSDLRQFPPPTRLPTLLHDKYIVITNSSQDNFAVDDSQLTHPDIFVNSVFSVHGVRNVLDYLVFGDGRVPSPPPLPPGASLGPPAKRNPISPGEINVRSPASSSCSWFWMPFPVFCTFLLLLEIY